MGEKGGGGGDDNERLCATEPRLRQKGFPFTGIKIEIAKPADRQMYAK